MSFSSEMSKKINVDPILRFLIENKSPKGTSVCANKLPLITFLASLGVPSQAVLQVIPALGTQRLMGPKVVYFLKCLSLLRPTILLYRKRLIIIRSITGNQNREIGEELWRKIFKNFTQKPPGKNIQGVPRTQDI